MSVTVTAATEADLPDIASIHIQSWRETYVGLMPQAYLDGLNVADRLKQWHGGFSSVAQGKQALFIARMDGKTIGFISIGPARDEAYHAMGEIYAVYLPQAMWGRGVGYALYLRAVEWFRNKGQNAAYLWVLDGNLHAIESYRRWGGRPDMNIVKHQEVGGQSIGEILAVFENL